MAGAPFVPMLAQPGQLPTGTGWAFELKWDGVRAIAVVGSGRPAFYARSGVEITIAYPELAGLGADGALDDTILDGEMVAFDGDGRPSFTLLAERMHVRDRAKADRLAATVPVTYLVFDVLRLHGVDLLDRPYAQRRALLDELLLAGPAGHVPVAVPPAFDDGPATMAASRENGLEGVVAKRLDAVYRPGARTTDWIKVKLEETADLVVGGWRPGARLIGALLVGVPAPAPAIASLPGAVAPPGGLAFRGRVGGGISAAAERALLAVLRPLVVPASPFGATIPREDARTAFWVRPEVVVEVRYGNRTPDRRLRFPRFLRLRPDKPASEVVDE